MRDPIFRRAVAGDLPRIVALLADDPLGGAREIPADPLPERYRQAFEAVDGNANQLLAVAEKDGRVIGTLQLSFIPGISHGGAWRGQIEAVRVAAENRGKGVGAALLAWAIGQCRDRGCGLVQLTTDRSRTDAHRFYDRLGFKPTHVGYKLKLSGPG